jgi:tRNA-specific 2-thiouridylase
MAIQDNKIQKPGVLLAMSGGVDSSVAALLLKKQGYNVIGAFMKNWSDTKDMRTGECKWRQERRDAARIASLLNIPLITLDFEKEYKKIVVKQMFKDYKQGITPNPDILCNEKVKFPLLWEAAQKLKAQRIATGHHARIIKKENKYLLLRGKDESKDQSYFLYRLAQKDLQHTLFPIGDYTKDEVRKIAKQNKFPNHDKKSTVGICFIGKVNLKEFLQQKIKPKKGRILSPKGDVIGEHDGIYYYTINQRIGPRFGIDVKKTADNPQFQKRWYVAQKDIKTNTIIASPENHPILYRKEIFIQNPNWISKYPQSKEKVLVRIRQVGELMPAILEKINGKYKINLSKAITGISKGQAIVFYQGRIVIGGGTISY